MTTFTLRPPIALALLLPLAALLGAGAALRQTEVVMLLGAVLLAAIVVLAWRAELLDAWSLALVALLSANYNVFVNANAFIEGGSDRGKAITIAATIGLLLFTLAQDQRRRSRGVPFRVERIDGLFALLFLTASIAFGAGLHKSNPGVYLYGDYGQLLQVLAAYAAVRTYTAVSEPDTMRSFLVLLALSWGLRAAAELLFPGLRGTAVIELEGQTLFRRTDPLGPLAIPLLAGLLLSERRLDRAGLLLGCLGLIAAQNVLGFTRAHYFALGIALPLLLLAAFAHREGRDRLLRAAPFAGIVLIVAYVLVAPVRTATSEAWNRLQDGFDSQTHSRIHREAENHAVVEVIEQEPLFGSGLGAEYMGVEPESLQPAVVHFIHNDYLALWLRGGIVLLISWVAILLFAIWRGATTPSPLGALTSVGAAAGLIGAGGTAVVSGAAFGYVVGPITALLVVMATWRASPEPARDERRAADESQPAFGLAMTGEPAGGG